jgi:hypothetical protein
MDNIVKIKNEIKILMDDIENKENIILEKIKTNQQDIDIYKAFLENIIEEYHNVCLKIFK